MLGVRSVTICISCTPAKGSTYVDKLLKTKSDLYELERPASPLLLRDTRKDVSNALAMLSASHAALATEHNDLRHWGERGT